MLKGIDPMLTGDVLLALDRMGHSDLVVVADAHFPAWRMGPVVIDIAGTSPRVIEAVVSVLALDDVHPVRLMAAGTGAEGLRPALIAATGVAPESTEVIDRSDFYSAAAGSSLILRTAEAGLNGNVILRKGVTPSAEGAVL